MVTVPSTQTVGQPLTLKCVGTAVRGITSKVGIVWRQHANGKNIVASTRVTGTGTIMDNSVIYTDSYTISPLSTSDQGVVYQCRLVVCTKPTIKINDSVRLNVTGKFYAHFPNDNCHPCIHMYICTW